MKLAEKKKQRTSTKEGQPAKQAGLLPQHWSRFDTFSAALAWIRPSDPKNWIAFTAACPELAFFKLKMQFHKTGNEFCVVAFFFSLILETKCLLVQKVGLTFFVWVPAAPSLKMPHTCMHTQTHTLALIHTSHCQLDPSHASLLIPWASPERETKQRVQSLRI